MELDLYSSRTIKLTEMQSFLTEQKCAPNLGALGQYLTDSDFIQTVKKIKPKDVVKFVKLYEVYSAKPNKALKLMLFWAVLKFVDKRSHSFIVKGQPEKLSWRLFYNNNWLFVLLASSLYAFFWRALLVNK